jgi:hypothetical protein
VRKQKAAKKEKINMRNTPFAFGQMITPTYDVIGSYLTESGVSQICVDKALLRKLARHHHTVDWASWKKGPYVCSKARDLMRVSRTHYGWRSYCRNHGHGPRNILAMALVQVPVLFPTAETAIVATEVFSAGQRWDIATLGWQGPWGGDLRYAPLSPER